MLGRAKPTAAAAEARRDPRKRTRHASKNSPITPDLDAISKCILQPLNRPDVSFSFFFFVFLLVLFRLRLLLLVLFLLLFLLLRLLVLRPSPFVVLLVLRACVRPMIYSAGVGLVDTPAPLVPHCSLFLSLVIGRGARSVTFSSPSFLIVVTDCQGLPFSSPPPPPPPLSPPSLPPPPPPPPPNSSSLFLLLLFRVFSHYRSYFGYSFFISRDQSSSLSISKVDRFRSNGRYHHTTHKHTPQKEIIKNKKIGA